MVGCLCGLIVNQAVYASVAFVDFCNSSQKISQPVKERKHTVKENCLPFAVYQFLALFFLKLKFIPSIWPDVPTANYSSNAFSVYLSTVI